ncbi:MAG: MFS transporter [Lentisphaeria bacterium]|nr:MFS transporter [Lentisphaeria bacterium]
MTSSSISMTASLDLPTQSRGFRAFVTTQFLGAFNDNAFKLVVSLYAVSSLSSSDARNTSLALAGMFFTLPFILFSTYAGSLADRFSKRRIMIASKVAEIIVMGFGAAAFCVGSIAALLAVVFLMGAQSAFFGPAKYGCMPEMLRGKDLPKANGIVQLATFLAIIAGTVAGGRLSAFLGKSIWTTSAFFMGVAAIGTLTSLGIPAMKPADPDRALCFNPGPELASSLRELRQQPSLAKCTAATAFFWFMSALFQVTLLLHAKERMALDDRATGWLLASLGLGIGLGSAFTGHLSRHRIRFGFTPVGGLLMAACSIGLVLASASCVLTAIVLFILGVGGGFYGIPLISHLQKASPKGSRGRLMAFRNMMNFSAMLLAYPIFWICSRLLGFSSAGIFMLAGGLMIVVAFITAKELAEPLILDVLRLALRPFYRLKATGVDHIPETGGALIVCNHISYADPLLLLAACPRPIRFIMARSFFTKKRLNPIARMAGAIPISADDSPRDIAKALHLAGQRVAAGEVVGIFAEGALTRTGALQAFNRGLEIIMRKQTAPIIPACLEGLHGTAYTYHNGRFVSPWTSHFPVKVSLAFGSPLPAATPAHDVRQVVSELAADLSMATALTERVSTRFLRTAKKCPFRPCAADNGKAPLSYAALAVRALALGRHLATRCEAAETVGILLPSSVPCAVTNLAVTLIGKTPVNLNFTVGGDCLAKAMEACDMDVVITSRAFLQKAALPTDPRYLCLEELNKRELERAGRFSALAFWMLPSHFVAGLWRRGGRTTPENLATILFSSGSTGTPKGVMLSHANVNANVEALRRTLQLGKHDKVLGNLPCFHSFGLLGNLWYPFICGHSVVYCPNPLDFNAVGKACEAYNITVIITPPTFLSGIFRRCGKEQLASVRQVITGAEKLSPKLAAMFERKFGVTPREGYGCTELSPAAALNLPDVSHGQWTQEGGRPGTVGRALPGVAVKIVTPDSLEDPRSSGQTAPCGEQGVLLVRGANVMLGYFGDPERSAEVLRDGWYVTGDIAAVDRDGFITIHDRLSRFSKIGGEMVPHERVEEEINAIIGTMCDRKCVVTGVPDDKKGERLVALCATDVDLDQVHRELTASGLPNLWIPRRQAFVHVEKFPILGTGKLDLREIKHLAVTTA